MLQELLPKKTVHQNQTLTAPHTLSAPWKAVRNGDLSPRISPEFPPLTRCRLADYLFMLQDYPEALNMYRNSSKDFQNDKAWRWLAAGSEMAGLASFLLDSSRKDPETFFENAYVHYYKGK